MVSVFYINMKIYIQRCHVQMRFAEEIQAEQELSFPGSLYMDNYCAEMLCKQGKLNLKSKAIIYFIICIVK